MRILKRVFDFYINSSIHVALAVCALCYLSLAHWGVVFEFNLFGFIFTASITAYNFVKYAAVARLHHRTLARSMRWIQSFSFLCFAALLYFVFQLPFRVILACLPIGVLTLLYAIPILPDNKNLRRVPTLKVFIIALVWAGLTVYIPSVYYKIELDWHLIYLLLERVILVLCLMIPFEIRDLKFDVSALRTVPQLYGIKKTKMMGGVLLLFYVILLVLEKVPCLNVLSAEGVLILATALSILFAKKEQSLYYAAFWVEGIPLLAAGILLLTSC